MKRTKNMVFTPSAESRELFLYASNNSAIYFSRILPIVKNLKKHLAKNQYNTEKAVIAFYHVMTEASNLYCRDFGFMFTVTERYTAAIEMEREFTENNYNM